MNKYVIDDKTKRFEGYQEGSILNTKVPQLKGQPGPLRAANLKNPLIKKSPFNVGGSK